MKSVERLNKAFAGSCATLLLFALLMAFATHVAAEPTEVNTGLPDLAAPRAGAGVEIGDDGLIYIFGGWEDFGAFAQTVDTVLIYNPETGQTDFGPTMTVGVGGAASAKGLDGEIYLFGGYNSTVANYYNGVQIFDPATSTWVTDTPMPANSYMGGAACGVDGRLYVFGGWTVATGAINYTLIYDPGSLGTKWSYGTDLPDPRWAPGVVTVSDTQIMVAGGSDFGGIVGATSFYNPVTNEWSDGGDLMTARHSFGLAMGRNGYAYAIGGTSYWAWPNYDPPDPSLSSVERYDFAAGAWELADVSLSYSRSFQGTVVNANGFVISVGGWDGTSTLVSVEAFLPSNVTGLTELEIVSPSDGSIVSGTVDVQVTIKNNVGFSWFMSMDFLVDGALIETQWSGSSWTFLWNTSSLLDGSMHTITARGYDWDMSIVEDSITVTVWSQSVEERVAALQQQLADALAQLADLRAQLAIQDTNLTALRAQTTELQAQVTALQAALVAMDASQTAAMNGLNATLADLQQQLNDMQAQLDKVKTTSSSGSMWGMVDLVLIIVVIVLLVLMLMMSRKKT